MSAIRHITRCLLFPGQGSQKAGTINHIINKYAYTRHILEQADEACNISLSKIMLDQSTNAEQLIKPTEIAQPAILTHSYIIWSVIQRELGILDKHSLSRYVSCALGHSLGEFTALCAARSIDFTDAVRLVRKRGELMRDAAVNQSVTPAMAALMPCSKQFAELVCQHVMNDNHLSLNSPLGRKCVVQPANFNTANQTVISGDAAAVDRAIEIAKQGLNGIKVKRAVKLSVSAPFHCSLMQDAEDQFDQYIQSIKWETPIIPVISNVTAEPVRSIEEIKTALKHHITSPVMFHQSIQLLMQKSPTTCNTFLEMGPSAVLGPMTQSIAKDDGTTISVTSLCSVEQIDSFIEQQQAV